MVGEARVERVGEPSEIVGLHLGAELEQALGGDPERGDDDRDAGVRREPDQLHVLEALHLLLRLRHEGQIVRQAPKQPSRAVDDLVELARRVAELVVNAAPLDLRQLLRLHELVDIRTIARVGGNPAGGGVRLDQVAPGLELRHLVTNGRRADAEVILLGERLRTHRLGRGDVLVDDRGEDVGPTLA